MAHRLLASGDCSPEHKTADRNTSVTLRAAADTIGEEVGGDLLGLIFTACHPVLSKDAQILQFGTLPPQFVGPISSCVDRGPGTISELTGRFHGGVR